MNEHRLKIKQNIFCLFYSLELFMKNRWIINSKKKTILILCQIIVELKQEYLLERWLFYIFK
jgi:hypothetical protein